MVRKLGLQILVFSFSLGFIVGPLRANDLKEELATLKQRKIDFRKDRVYFSEDPPLTHAEKADLVKLLNRREREQATEEKVRSHYVQTRKKDDDLDATKREAIEQKIQDRDEERQVTREKKFAQIENRREHMIDQAHLEINGSEEYDIRIPKKENHAKARTPKAKK